jgi:hypothetical protein
MREDTHKKLMSLRQSMAKWNAFVAGFKGTAGREPEANEYEARDVELETPQKCFARGLELGRKNNDAGSQD